MKNYSKLLLVSLFALASFAGCKKKDSDAEARPTDYKANIGALIMEDIYDEVLASQGYAAMFDEILYKIATVGEKIDTRRHDELVERVAEKVTELQLESTYTEYGDYVKNAPGTEFTADGEERDYGVFLADLASAKFRADGYDISCNGATDCDVWNVSKVLDKNEKEVNTYISFKLQRDILKEMLNEEYIIAKKSSFYSSTQFRRVETVHVDFDQEDHIGSTNKLLAYEKALINGTDLSGQASNGSSILQEIEEDWRDFKVQKIEEEIAKIGTDDDKDQLIQAKYTCGERSEICINKAKKSADEVEYYQEAEIMTNSSTIVNSNLTSRIFSTNILSASNKALYLYEDPTNVEGEEQFFYMKKFVDEQLPNLEISNTGDSGDTYFVRVSFIENAADSLTNEAKVELRYELARNLAQKSTNITGNILHYLNEYKITIHDQEFYDYVKTQYDYPED